MMMTQHICRSFRTLLLSTHIFPSLVRGFARRCCVLSRRRIASTASHTKKYGAVLLVHNKKQRSMELKMENERVANHADSRLGAVPEGEAQSAADGGQAQEERSNNKFDVMEGVGENGYNEESAGCQEYPPMPYKPQAPPRTEAPGVFKAWRQETNGPMMTQAVVQDDADTLTWMLKHNLIDLTETDELGNTAAHLAVFHDSPRVLRLLHNLGVDLSGKCDAEGFGSAIFYSVFLGRVDCLSELIELGYDMVPPCDRLGRTPETVAIRHDQGAALTLVRRSLATLDIQRVVRGFLGRSRALSLQKGIRTKLDVSTTPVGTDDNGHLVSNKGITGDHHWEGVVALGHGTVEGDPRTDATGQEGSSSGPNEAVQSEP